ncbi:MAG TPA: hypothetical protein DIS88_04920 [Prevotella sp.]|nr:hypothetical protein [Prevotella sp.]
MRKYWIIILLSLFSCTLSAQVDKKVKTYPEKKTMKEQKILQESSSPIQSSQKVNASPVTGENKNEFSKSNDSHQAIDTIALKKRIWTHDDSLAVLMYQYENRYLEINRLRRPGMYDYSSSGTILRSGPFLLEGASSYREMPNMLGIQSASLSASQEVGNLSIQAQVMGNRYMTTKMTNQFGAGLSLSYRFNDYISATAFGHYYSKNPFFYMATFPYVPTTNFGGFFTFDSGSVGMDLGVRHYYNPFIRRWDTAPIVTPKFHFSNKFTMEIPLGDALRSVLERALHIGPHGPMIPSPRR